jgi:hypothetical protein
MFSLGLTVGAIIGAALGIALTALVIDEKKDDTFKCEIEEIWIDGGENR